MAGGVVLDENNCYICSLELRYGVMVALQILVLSAQVRILVPQLCSAKLSLLRKRTISTPSLRDSPFQGQAGSASLRRASPLLRCLRHLADAPPRRLCGPCGSRFPTLRCKVPRPRRCSDEHFLVKPFSSIFAGRLCCFDVCDISLTLRRAACAAPAGVAFQFCRGKIPAPGGPLMRTF